MKKVFLSIAMIAGCVLGATNVFAQANKAATTQQQDHTDKADGVYMVNNKPMIMKGGRAEPLQHDMKMANGVIVKPNGAIKRPDGSQSTLKNGDIITMQGQVATKNDKK